VNWRERLVAGLTKPIFWAVSLAVPFVVWAFGCVDRMMAVNWRERLVAGLTKPIFWAVSLAVPFVAYAFGCVDLLMGW